MRAVPKWILGIAIFALAACSQSAQKDGPDLSQTYDLYIHGGTLIDGTGRGGHTGDVLVSGSQIVYAGVLNSENVKADTRIDANGKVVTPGFIDPHAHGAPMQGDNDYMRSFLRQGVTTIILGQDGSNPGTIHSIKAWLDAVDAHGTGPNIAALVGHGSIRKASGGRDKEKITADELANMQVLLAQGMQQGAYGMSTGLEYVPGRYADIDELNALAKTVAAHGGLISSHIRSEDDDKVEAAIAEVIAQAEFAPVNITHMKVVYGKTKRQGVMVLGLIHEARRAGRPVSADVYPYLASYGSLIFLYPDWAKRKSEFDDAVANRREELQDYLRAKIKRRGGPDAVLISKGEYAGQTLGAVAKANGLSPEEQVIAFGYSGPSSAHFIMSKDTQDVFITAPDVSISSDGSPTMRHPRSFGSFAKIIEDYVVRDKMLSLELAVHKMSGLTALTFGLESRGILAPGKAADILVFDPKAVKAGTSWSDIYALPSGFNIVIVNGKVTDTSPGSDAPVYGRALRKTNLD